MWLDRCWGLGGLGGVGSTSVLSLTSLKLPLSSDSAPASQFVDECPGPRQRADSAQQGFWRAPRKGRPRKWPGGSEVGVTASSLQLQFFSAPTPTPHSSGSLNGAGLYGANRSLEQTLGGQLLVSYASQPCPHHFRTSGFVCVHVCLCVHSASRCG